jgi:hypothetical protein
MGGGFLGLGATIIWLCYALTQGARWAPWGIMSISIVALVPMLAVAVQLRSVEPKAQTPIFPSIVAIGLVAIGSIAALFR